MARKPINLFGTGIRSISPFITAQRRVNVYFDLRPDGDKWQIAIISRPGLTLFVTLPTFPVRGMLQVGLFAYVVAGSVLYVVTPTGGYAVLGTLNTVTPTTVSMAANQNQICVVDGSYGYVLNNYQGLAALILNQQSVGGFFEQNISPPQTLSDFQFLRDIQGNNVA